MVICFFGIKEGVHFNVYKPILKVDPNMRCAVMLIYGCKLVVLSFLEDMTNGRDNANRASYDSAKASVHGSFVKADPDQPQIVDIKTGQPNGTTLANSLKSYVIDLRKLDKWLETRIIDIEFLFGYYEPTQFILCESTRTWVGRYSVKKDTCNSVALSLNLQQKTHPIIWPVEKLPSDSLKCLAVPLTIGGVLIFSVNSLIYINQSVPAFGVSLNSITKSITNYPLKSMEHLKITLDCTRALFIAPDKFMMSLRNGEIYMVTLVTDLESARTVRNFYFEKQATSVVASCLVKCTDNHYFIGSRLANSVLLKCSPKLEEDTSMAVDDAVAEIGTFSNPKRTRFDSDGNPSSISDEEEDEGDEHEEEEDMDKQGSPKEPSSQAATVNRNNELESLLSRAEDASATDVSNYTFEICDMIINVGPCAHSLIGESVGDYSEYSERSQYYIDYITSSGYGKNAGISIMQRSLRPEILATFKVTDSVDLWTVQTASSTYLFISKLDSTMILQLDEEIIELDRDNSVFSTNYPTLYCANILDNKYILQVTTKYINVYKEQSASSEPSLFLYCSLELTNRFDSKIKATSAVNNIITLLTETGTIHLLAFNEAEKSITELNTNGVKSLEAVACFALFKDENNFFTTVHKANSSSSAKKATIMTAEPSKNSSYLFDNDPNDTSQNMGNYDEDALIYGKTETSIGDLQAKLYPGLKGKSDTSALNSSFYNENTLSKSKNSEKNTNTFYMLLTVSTDGLLNVHWIKEGSTVVSCFTVAKFNYLSNVVHLMHKDSAPSLVTMQSMDSVHVTAPKSAVTSLKSANEFDQPVIQEINLTSTGAPDKKRYYLFVKTDDELVVYEMFSMVNEIVNENVDKEFYNYDEFYNLNEIQLKRINHDVIIRDKKKKKASLRKLNLEQPTKSATEAGSSEEAKSSEVNGGESFVRTKFCPTLKSFTSLANFDGMFFGGANPHVVFFCPRSGLTPHPIWIDGPILSFSPLSSSQIAQNGFIYLNSNSDVRICNLPVEENGGRTPVHYDFPWTLRKTHTQQTVHFIYYHEESKTYAVVTSVLESTNKLMQLGGDEKDAETLERDENFILPQKNRFYIQLYTSTTWVRHLESGRVSMAT